MNIIEDGIILRAIERKDNNILKQLINSPEVEACVIGWSFPSSDEKQEQWYDRVTLSTDMSHVRYAVEVEGECIGMAGLNTIDWKNSNARVDIKLIEASRGKGIGYKVICMLEKYAFEELNLHMLISRVLENNMASRKTFEKAGFILEGLMRCRVYKRGNYHGQCVYSILKEEYEKNVQK